MWHPWLVKLSSLDMHQLLQRDPDIQYTLPIVHHSSLCNTICTHIWCTHTQAHTHTHTVLPHSLTQYTAATTHKQEDLLHQDARLNFRSDRPHELFKVCLANASAAEPLSCVLCVHVVCVGAWSGNVFANVCMCVCHWIGMFCKSLCKGISLVWWLVSSLSWHSV